MSYYDEDPEQDCGCERGQPCERCEWWEDDDEYDRRDLDEDYNPWERDNDEPELA